MHVVLVACCNKQDQEFLLVPLNAGLFLMDRAGGTVRRDDLGLTSRPGASARSAASSQSAAIAAHNSGRRRFAHDPPPDCNAIVCSSSAAFFHSEIWDIALPRKPPL